MEIDGYAPELVQLLTSRRPGRAREAAAATARMFARLPGASRAVAVSAARERLVAAAPTRRDPHPLARRSLAALAGATADDGLARMLPELLLDSDAGVADAAEAAIEALASNAACAPLAGAVLLDAMVGFDQHRRRSILLAGVQRLGRPAELAAAVEARAEWLGDAAHPAQLAIRSLIRREAGPEVARAALVWLRVPAQAPACRERLLRVAGGDEHEAVLQAAHLLGHPQRMRALKPRASSSRRGGAAEHEPARWRLDVATLGELTEGARRQIPRFASALPIDAGDAAETRSMLVGDESPAVRLAAVVAPGPGMESSSLTDLAYDQDASIARCAALRLIHAGEGARVQTDESVRRTISRLRRSPHAGVRAACVAAWVDADGPAGRAAWRLALRRDRASALAEIRDGLLMGPLSERMAWISRCRLMGVAPELERELCDMVEEMGGCGVDGDGVSPERAIAATAVVALADCTAARSASVLEESLRAADARIAANAVESIARRRRRQPEAGDRWLPAIVEVKDAPEHRVRANAALALLREGGSEVGRLGVESLDEMLVDERAMHRLAGVWLADRAASSGMIEPKALVEPLQLLRHDADARVRERAKLARQRLGALAGAREIVA